MAALSQENRDKLALARANVENLSANLPSVVDPASISYEAKIPYKVLVFREAILWRTEELARCSCDLIESGNICSALVLIRATTENAAALIYLADFMANSIERGLPPDADDKAMSLLMGHKSWDEMPKAINVLTMLRKAEKVAPLIGEVYADLCEYSHPNWAGSAGLFSQHDREQILTNLGKYPRGIDRPAAMGLAALLGAIELVIYAYNKAADMMPDFIGACEAALPEASTDA